jgi:hypothetical protein
MTRRAFVLVVTLFLALAGALAGGTPANAETTQPTFLTFYG